MHGEEGGEEESQRAQESARPWQAHDIRIKRAYDPPGSDDGLRILIDRLWPRGMPKQSSSSTPGSKHLSPSNALRKWYRHDPEKFAEFRKRYSPS